MDNWRRTLLKVILGSLSYAATQFASFLLMMTLPGILKVLNIFPFSYNLVIPTISILILSIHSVVRNYHAFTKSIIDIYPLLGFLIVSGCLYLYSASEKATFDFGITQAVSASFVLFALIYVAYLAIKYLLLAIRDKYYRQK